MTNLSQSQNDAYTSVLTNVSSEQPRQRESECAKYDEASAPHRQLPSHPQPEAKPCSPEYPPQQAPDKELPHVPWDGGGGEKGPMNKPIPGDQ